MTYAPGPGEWTRERDAERAKAAAPDHVAGARKMGEPATVTVQALRELIATSGRFCRPRQPSIPIEDIEALIGKAQATLPATNAEPWYRVDWDLCGCQIDGRGKTADGWGAVRPIEVRIVHCAAHRAGSLPSAP